MKKLFIVLIFLLLKNVAFAQSLQQIWQTDTTLTTCESVLYDKKNKCLYVSCINGRGSLDNRGSFVAKMSLEGKVIQRIWADSLNSIKGMGLLGDRLFAAEMEAVAEIDTKTGRVVKRHALDGAKMLNDITTDPKTNTLYITDMRANQVWQLRDGAFKKLLDGAPLNRPNGLFYEKNTLLIGNGGGTLYRLDLATSQLSTVAEGIGDEKSGIDGIEADGKGGYYLTEWVGRVWHVSKTGAISRLLDTSAVSRNTADIEYIPAKKLLLVPTFFHNRVIAYRAKF
jgi:hypothetical protein